MKKIAEKKRTVFLIALISFGEATMIFSLPEAAYKKITATAKNH